MIRMTLLCCLAVVSFVIPSALGAPSHFLVALDENNEETDEQYLYNPATKQWKVTPKDSNWGVYTPSALAKAFPKVGFSEVTYCGVAFAATENVTKWLASHVALNHSIELHRDNKKVCTVRERTPNAPGFANILCQGDLSGVLVELQHGNTITVVCSSQAGGVTAFLAPGTTLNIRTLCKATSASDCVVKLALKGVYVLRSGGAQPLREISYNLGPKDVKQEQIKVDGSPQADPPKSQAPPSQQKKNDDLAFLETAPGKLALIEKSAKPLREINLWLRNERLSINVQGGKCVKVDVDNLASLVEKVRAINISPLDELREFLKNAQATKARLLLSAKQSTDKAAKSIIESRLGAYDEVIDNGKALLALLEIAAISRGEYVRQFEERIKACS